MKLEIMEDEFLPTVLRTGATYFVSPKVLLHTELVTGFDVPFAFKAGSEFELVDNLWLRLGFQSQPTRFNTGAGYQFKNGLRIDLAVYYQRGLEVISSGPLSYAGLVTSIGVGIDI